MIRTAMTPLVLFLATLTIPSGVAAQPATRLTLIGTLGQSYLIRMDLERNGNALRGNYIYERAGVIRSGNNRIDLAGSIDAAGKVSLIESASIPGRDARSKTGEFNGSLTSIVIDGESLFRLSGSWTRARDGQSLPFTLDQQSQRIGNSTLVPNEEKEEKRELNYTLRLNLPLTREAQSPLNQYLKSITKPLTSRFTKDVAELRREMADIRADLPPSSLDIDHQVATLTPDLLSLLLTIYSYNGGAHPNTSTISVNWDPRLNRSLQLADLFLPQSAYGQTISTYCRRELSKLALGDPRWLADGTRFTAENYHSWNPVRAGLRITIDAYQIAAYAQGSFEVTVPWSLLRPFIRPNGPLSTFR